jgi:hypothetical protein
MQRNCKRYLAKHNADLEGREYTLEENEEEEKE